MSSPGSSFSGIEPLEARIAPARIIVGGNPNTNTDTDYDEEPFVNIANASADDAIANFIKGGAPGVPDTYYLKLFAGDKLKIFTTGNDAQDYLVVKTGTVVAFFVDKNDNNEVDAEELVSLSLGKNSSITLKGSIEGDIVANLSDDGNSLLSGAAVSTLHDIKGLSIGGNGVAGKIIAGGNISNVSANGNVGAILAGGAAGRLNPDGETFDFLPGLDGGTGTIKFDIPVGKTGGSITNIAVDGIGTSLITGDAARIEAGAGGAGAAGGSVKNVRILEDADGFTIRAGAGGAGGAGGSLGKTNGGAGGSISKVSVSGVPDTSSGDLIRFVAGAGGSATTDAGVGGKGGAVSDIFVGYQLIGKKYFQTLDVLNDIVTVESGAGGAGKNGGAGGLVTRLDLLTSADVEAATELVVTAGAGGNAIVEGTGKAGAGGSISSVKIRDIAIEPVGTALTTGVMLQAGAGGSAVAGAAGAVGGSISNANLVGSEFQVIAGNGSDGKTGGRGGDLRNILLDQAEGVVPHKATFNAGEGGDGSNGAGGAGGMINTLRNDIGDFVELNINTGTAGNGGGSVGGRGGNGGAVTRLDLFDTDTGAGSNGVFTLRTGDGGSGTKGGGNGGLLSGLQFTSLDMSQSVKSGSGGSAVGTDAAGKGGNGGLIQGVQLQANVSLVSTVITTQVIAGAGGNGAGGVGAGGAGGGITGVNLVADGTSLMRAGNGGNGDGRAAGNGGSVLNSGVFAQDLTRLTTEPVAGNGSGAIFAGDAGAEGAAPGNGGSIRGASDKKLSGLYADADLTLQAGNGSHGGSGGSILYIGYGSTADDLLPTPSGNILIKAGDGSAEGRFGGAGGSISHVSGAASSGAASTTLIVAGNGGIAPSGGTKAGAGGSVTDLTVFLGGPVAGVGGDLRIKAGDAGDGGTDVRVGAKGGDVRDVRVSEMSEDLIFRSVAAGNGGSGSEIGGRGGSVTQLRVLDHDIGVRQGANYGYDSMGGIFAGAGGAGIQKGLAGNVSGVSANAIAAIVAGRGEVPELVEKVEKIYISTPRETGLPATDLLRASEGDLNLAEPGDKRFYAFDEIAYQLANLVGAVVDPLRVDANRFDFTDVDTTDAVEGVKVYTPGVDKPIDGLIAAKVFNQATVNFTPEARVVGSAFYDYDNQT